MKIRTATVADMDGILALYREQFEKMKELQPYFFQDGEQSRQFITDMIEGVESDVLVCISEDCIAGFALVQVKETPAFPFFIHHRFG